MQVTVLTPNIDNLWSITLQVLERLGVTVGKVPAPHLAGSREHHLRFAPHNDHYVVEPFEFEPIRDRQTKLFLLVEGNGSLAHTETHAFAHAPGGSFAHTNAHIDVHFPDNFHTNWLL